MCVHEYEITTMNYLKTFSLPIYNSMNSILEFKWFKTIITCIISFVSFFIHSNVLGVGVLVGLVIIDQIIGVYIALKNRTFTSSSFRNGLIKLLLYLIIVSVFHLLSYVNPVFNFLGLDTAAITWLALTEVISIVENSCIILNLPFPSGILDKLRVFSVQRKKDKSDVQ